MRITLSVIEGPHQGLEFEFARHDTFLVGRSGHAHFQLPTKDRYFSRIHFMIEVNPPQCRLVDMGSHNGTYVNGQRKLSVDLNDGDQIRAGHTTLRLTMKREPHESSSLIVPAAEMQKERSRLAQPLDFPFDLVPGFHLERRLGQGNMGVTYLARRLADETFAALKLVRPDNPGGPEQVAAFLKEARALRGLNHPHIVRFQEMGEASGALFFAMDYVAGADAGTILNREGPLCVDRAVRVIAQVLQALEFGHARSVIHRDIKPTNILVRGAAGKEEVKLGDYGLARTYQSSPLSGLTITRDIVASAPYMPPELITNYRQPTLFSDQYAAAATLYFLLTGEPAFDFPNETHLKFSLLLRQQAVPIRRRRPQLSEELAAVIHQALHRNPKHRFADVAAFRAALLRAAGTDN